MKSLLVLFVSLALVFLPIALASTFTSDLLLPSEKASKPKAILDTDGNPVKVGSKYFVVPTLAGLGGGLILSRVVNKDVKVCPQDVVQDPNELHQGRPVTFYPAYNNTGGKIFVNNPINVKFFSTNEASRCADFTVWKMDKKYKYVVGRGTVGALDKIRNWFRIIPYGKQGYRFVYCPTLCVPCKIKCNDLSISYEGQADNKDIRRLAALANELPFAVYFKKAD